MIRGKLDPPEAAKYVIVNKAQQQAAGARYGRARHLRSGGFLVVHTSSKANKLHLSIVRPCEEHEGQYATDWSPQLREDFDRCFNRSDGGDEDADSGGSATVVADG